MLGIDVKRESGIGLVGLAFGINEFKSRDMWRSGNALRLTLYL